jgi:hypothetical protein
MQVHVHWLNLVRKQIKSNQIKLWILNQKATRVFLTIWLVIYMNSMFKISTSVHVQEIIMQKNMFSCP